MARSFMIEVGESSARHEVDESPERRATSSYALASHQIAGSSLTKMALAGGFDQRKMGRSECPSWMLESQ